MAKDIQINALIRKDDTETLDAVEKIKEQGGNFSATMRRLLREHVKRGFRFDGEG